MKKFNKLFNLIIILLLISSFTFLSSCKKSEKEEEEVDLGELNETIYVVSDIHLLANSLINEAVTKDMLTSDGRCQELDYDLLNALIDKVNIEKPNYLIITGDLTFNGELASHQEVANILSKVTSTKVLVIPGNHDTYNLVSRSYIDRVIQSVPTVTDEEFIEIYSNYGYSDCISKDEKTNSYVYKLNDNLWAMMLDTNLSRFNYDEGMNFTSGYIYGETYDWMIENLKYAQENNIEVISFTHHNLITHNAMFEDNYTLGDAEAIKEIYKQYGVKLNFSGHLHIQSIKEEDGFYDIASGSLLDYGCRYGILEVYSNGYSYNSYQSELDSVNVKEYTFQRFYDRYYAKQSVDESIYGKNTEKIKDLLCKMNAYYFDGDYEAIYKLKKDNKKLIKLLQSNNKSEYIDIILNLENKSQNKLIIEK